MNISVTGTADKRGIVYPLLYTLNFLGSTALITNDTVYRRLLPEGAETGDIGNVHIDTSPRFNQEIAHYHELLSQEYEHSVIVTFNETDITDNKIFVIRDGEATNSKIYIRVGYAAAKPKELFIPYNDALHRMLYQIEQNSRFTPVKDTRVLKILIPVLATFFEKTEKDMKKLLLYKGGKVT